MTDNLKNQILTQPVIIGTKPVIDDPTKIPDADIKKYMVRHSVQAIDAYKDLLSQDLLNRVSVMQDKDLRIVLKILIQQCVGAGSKL